MVVCVLIEHRSERGMLEKGSTCRGKGKGKGLARALLLQQESLAQAAAIDEESEGFGV